MNTRTTPAPVGRDQRETESTEHAVASRNAVRALLTTTLATQSLLLLAVLWASPLSATGAVAALVARL